MLSVVGTFVTFQVLSLAPDSVVTTTKAYEVLAGKKPDLSELKLLLVL